MIFASDTDGQACRNLERCIEKYHLSDAVRVRQMDFFDVDPLELTERIGTICINPPYGRRLGGRQEAEAFFNAMGDKLKQSYRGWRLALLAPSQKVAKMLPFQTRSIPIRHGGLKLRLLIGKIK
jgi:putative N6-adenine-specific DNA methylase